LNNKLQEMVSESQRTCCAIVTMATSSVKRRTLCLPSRKDTQYTRLLDNSRNSAQSS